MIDYSEPESLVSCNYHIYTTRFDSVVAADNLDTVLGLPSLRTRSSIEEAWEELQVGLLAWKTKAHIVASEQSGILRAAYSTTSLHDIVVTLLIDQSGSMRGQKMLFVAATADVVQEFLLTLGVRCEILGFTTSRWKGGRSRARWNWSFRPSNPGRLNDLLHIIYQNADDVRASTGRLCLKHMLRPDLPKENIDGEAVEWAANRLRVRKESHKLLIVISDGAPVDDSTLSQNGSTFLADHLKAVVNELNDKSDIELASIGVGYATHDFYQNADYVEAPSDLGIITIKFLAKMIAKILK
jgi:cobaltochelatase CobT